MRMVRRKSGYVERHSFYCATCHDGQLHELGQQAMSPEGKEKNRQRQARLYADPVLGAQHREKTKARYQAAMQDPEKRKKIRKQKRKQWRRYQKTPKYKEMLVRRRVKKLELREDQLDLNPLVVLKGDPMVDWLYEQIDRYCEERDLSASDVFGPLMGGRNWGRWRSDSSAAKGRYLPLRMVDAVLVRLDLPHRLEDFDFKRRSDIRYGRLEQPDQQQDDDDQKDDTTADIHAPELPRTEAA
jgi:hypothetical protein